MQAGQLQKALKNLSAALREAESVLKAMRAEHDPLAVHIFVSRRQYRNMPDTKSGKRSETAARMSWQTACTLGYRGSLEEWERLIGAEPKW
jgi:hypothetical protein